MSRIVESKLLHVQIVLQSVEMGRPRDCTLKLGIQATSSII